MALFHNGKEIGDIWVGGKRIKWGILYNQNADYNNTSEGKPIQSIIYEWFDTGNQLVWALGLYGSTGCMTWENTTAPNTFCINIGDTADAIVRLSSDENRYFNAVVTATGYEDYAEITNNTVLFKKEGNIVLTLSYTLNGELYSTNVNVDIRDITFSIIES